MLNRGNQGRLSKEMMMSDNAGFISINNLLKEGNRETSCKFCKFLPKIPKHLCPLINNSLVFFGPLSAQPEQRI